VAAQRGIGVVIGSLLGELLGSLSSGWVQEFLALTFGLVFKVNVVGVIGIVIAALTLRRL
jgi:hypothetical protein